MKKLSRRAIIKIYKVLKSILRDRINSYITFSERRPATQLLTELEEEVILRYILNIDIRGFTPRLASVKDITNYILESRGERRVGKLWAYRFVQRRLELKTCFNRVYDF